jgi:hypothetical protein
MGKKPVDHDATMDLSLSQLVVDPVPAPPTRTAPKLPGMPAPKPPVVAAAKQPARPAPANDVSMWAYRVVGTDDFAPVPEQAKPRVRRWLVFLLVAVIAAAGGVFVYRYLIADPPPLEIKSSLSQDVPAWSPGPYEFERCVESFDVAVRGRVTKVEEVGKKPGGWILSRAHLAVERAYFGAGTAKQVTFYFWSSTDGDLTLKHELGANQRILVFLSTNLDPLKGVEPAPAGTKWMLQFAKANHRGYLYKLDKNTDGVEVIRDALFADDTTLVRTLRTAEAALAKKP